MKSSFANADQDQVPTAPEATPATENPASAASTQAPAAQSAQSSSLVTDGFFSNDGIEGEFDRSDLKMPRLNLVQAVGPLSGELGFIPGTFVYNKETTVGTIVKAPNGTVIGTDDLIVTLFGLRKYYLEDIPFGTSEEMPAFFKTLDDARRAGFLPIQDKRQMGEDHKYVKPVLDADVLIRGTAENVSFALDFNGTPYAAARWTVQSTAYSRVGKQFITGSTMALKQCGLLGKHYVVSARKEKLGKNFVFVPKAQIKGLNTPEFIEWAKNTVRS